MSSVDGFEDDDDTFYFEVEEIIQMYTTENGVRMFEIKWKNYSPENNTWEPEHNLNCPQILEEFLRREEQNKSEEEGKGKQRSVEAERKRKSKQRSQSVESEGKGKGKQRTQSVESDGNGKGKKGKGKAKAKEKGKSKERTHTVKEPTEIINQEDDNDEVVKQKEIDNKEDDEKKQDQEANVKGQEMIEQKKRSLDHVSDTSSKRKKFDNTIQAELSKSLAHTFTTLKRPATAPKMFEITDLVDIAKNPTSTKYHPLKPSPSPQQHVNTSTPPILIQIQPTPKRPTEMPMEWQLPTRQRPIEPTKQIQYTKPSSTPTTNLPIPIAPKPTLNNSPTRSDNNPTVPKSTLNNDRSDKVPTAPKSTLNSGRSDSTHLIKRQLSRPDPRLRPNNVKKLKMQNATAVATPFIMETILTKGDKLISSILLEGKQMCFHQMQIKRLISLTSNQNNTSEVRISTFLPLMRLNDFLVDRPFSILSITPKDNMVDLSKLKSFMQVNETVGVVSHPHIPTQALIVLPEVDLKKLPNMSTETGLDASPHMQLCALFLDDLPPRPKILLDRIDVPEEDMQLYSFNRVADYLKFPTELKKLKLTHTFIVYGHSEASTILHRVIKKQPNSSRNDQVYVMLFDRFSDSLFSKSLTKHKKEPATQIWEFGIPDLLVGQVLPACRSFPDNSGGFVTTDVQNIIKNPGIIDEITAQIKKFDEFPLVYGDWKFILPFNIIHHMKQAIRNEQSAEKVQLAIIAISVAMSKGAVQIMRLWPSIKQDTPVIQYMNHVIRNYYKYRQYFVYIDNIDSVSSQVKESYPSLDFVQSKHLYSTFS